MHVIETYAPGAAFSDNYLWGKLCVFMGQAVRGRNVPLMMQIRYVAGLQNASRDYPDLRDLVQKMAVLNLLADLFLPQSGSISADGLSQSLSMDLDKYRQSVAERIETVRQAIHGVRHMVF